MAIDPVRLADCLRVLAEVEALPVEHPDAVAVQRATAGLFKTVKKRRRAEQRAAVLAADAAVTAATATAAPGRIDDETRGLPPAAGTTAATGVPPAAGTTAATGVPPAAGTTVTTGVPPAAGTTAATGVPPAPRVPPAPGAPAAPGAGTLIRARACYVCKQRYRDVDAFYHQLCPPCAALNRARRDARTDLTGRRALLTGGRAKIGMYIALRLLRDGADTTITTRFPNDARRRFAAMPDSADWLERLSIVGIDLRDPAQVVALADAVGAQGPLDILINNAAQTVRRSAAAYAHLIAAEAALLPEGGPSPEHWSPTPAAVTALALRPGSASPERIAAGMAIDAGGLAPDLDPDNSWSRRVEEVDPVELLEVQLCNTTAPFILVSRLRPALAAAHARRAYIVNVSAMEGQFGGRRYKGPGHPHTNMAKAALNMLTRTSAQELLTDGILMTSVDTGWITDERPHPTRMRLAGEGFHAPLDLVDGAARVYDPIVRGESGEDLYGCFLKDYAPAAW